MVKLKSLKSKLNAIQIFQLTVTEIVRLIIFVLKIQIHNKIFCIQVNIFPIKTTTCSQVSRRQQYPLTCQKFNN